MADVDNVPFKPYDESQFEGYDRFDQATERAVDSVDSYTTSFTNALRGLDSVANQAAGLNLNAPEPFSPPQSLSLPNPPDVSIQHDLPSLPNQAQQGQFVPPAPVTLPELDLPDLGSAPGSGAITPSFPGAPSITNPNTNIDLPTIPQFTSPVTISAPPAMGTVNVPATPTPSNYTVNLPTAPDVSGYIQPMPSVPTPNLPILPNDFWDVPAFTGTPVTIPTPPAFNFVAYVLDDFVSNIKPVVENSITEMLATAALDQTYEQASYDAILSRELESSRLAMDNVPEEWADRGFGMPPGALFDMEQEVRREVERKAREGSRQIYVTRKEQELAVRNAALQAGTQMVSVDAQIYQIITSAQLEAYKFNEDQVLRSYDLALRAAGIAAEQVKIDADVFRAQLDGLRAKWSGYTTEISAEVARIEAVKAQISAIASGAEVGRSLVGMYTAQVDAETSVAKLYFERDRLLFDSWKAQVDVEVEKLKANAVYGDIIRAQASVIDAHARAYQAEVNGLISAAQLQGTVAQIEADIQKLYVTVYEAAVRGEAARISALSQLEQTRVQVYTEQARYQIAKANAIAQRYASTNSINASAIQAAAAAYQAQANAQASTNNSAAALMNAHSSLINAKRTKNEALVTAYKAQVDTLVLAYRAQVDTANSWYSRSLATWSQVIGKALAALQGLMDKHAAAAQVAGQVASSALQGTFVSLQVSEQKTKQQAEYWNYQLMNSLSEQYSVSS